MPVLRPLPAQPSLEFERKEAKALLRRLRAGDPDALARAGARHPRLEASTPTRLTLADAQLVIAREYGFASWPRLVRYFGDVQRQRHARRRVELPPDFFERNVRGWLAAHRDRRELIGRALAAYVPRFYGMRVEDVFAVAITEDDVRLAMARQYGCPSWDALRERAAAEAAQQPRDSLYRAQRAVATADLDAVKRIAETHPELLHPSADEAAAGRSLLAMALYHEMVPGMAAVRPIVDWLATHGLDLQRALNELLCGHIHMKPETVRRLLDRGADPNWVAPNGIPVLEHALIRYWNGAAVDVLAPHTTPRKALWIAAGLGDVDDVRRCLDRHGKPTPEARRVRPDFDVVGTSSIPSLPDPDGEELLLEAFLVAMFNGRTAVLEYMASRGAPVNSMIYGSPLLNVAVGNAWTPVVEALVRCGADVDLRGWHPTRTARELARELFERWPQDGTRRRIVELCGMDPDAILAERAAPPVKSPTVDPALHEALALAADDASRLRQPDVRPENLLFGLLRADGLPLGFFTRASQMDVERFRADVADRVRPAEDRMGHPELPLHPDAHAMIAAAIAFASERRRATVQGLHLLWALTRADHGPAAELLARYGSSAALVNAELDKAL